MSRPDGRQADELRPLTIETGVNIYAEGSALISAGNTRVLCTASVEEKVPPYKKGTGEGWVTAEYAMLPRATNTRNQRDGRRGRVDGRAQEIQRLIGRSFRPRSTWPGWGRGPSPSTATSSRPTPGPAAPPSPAASSPSMRPFASCRSPGCSRRSR